MKSFEIGFFSLIINSLEIYLISQCMITCSFLLPSTVGALYSKVLHSQVKNIRKEKNSTKGSKKQNLNLPHTNNYLLSIYMENSAVATGLEKVSFHPNPKEGQCQRMLKLPLNCTHVTYDQPRQHIKKQKYIFFYSLAFSIIQQMLTI